MSSSLEPHATPAVRRAGSKGGASRVRSAVLELVVGGRAEPPVRAGGCRGGGSGRHARSSGRRQSGSGPPHLLSVASLTPTKDQLTLAHALAQLADLPWTADLIGSDRADPDYAARVRTEIAAAGLAERITVPGALVGSALDQKWEYR